MHPEPSSFITLTYDDNNYAPSLHYPDYQKFMRALRYQRGSTRFFAVGEYGTETHRPHFHSVLFGTQFPNQTAIGKGLYRSAALEKLWPHGFSSIAPVNYETATYVAGYCLKKILGNSDQADTLRGRKNTTVDLRTGEVVDLVPEMAHMSLNPGIGATWFKKYWREVFAARDGCVLPGGAKVPPPRYYDKLLDKDDGFLKESIDYQRYLNMVANCDQGTPERLRVRENVALARKKHHSSRGL
jgi:hypothetical protein